jgi:hypothetical protein
MIKTMQDLVKRAQLYEPKTMAVAAANDQHVLEAVVMATEKIDSSDFDWGPKGN